MGKSRDVLDVIPETVVLAFDVAGWTSPADAKRIATSKGIVDAINKALAAEGQKLIKKHSAGATVTADDALKMLASAGKPFLENRQRELTQRVECAYKESPLGVWLDKHEWVLYVVLPLVVGGGGTYMYVARVGDTLAGAASSFANVKKSWRITHLGKIELGTTDVKFVPTKREIAAKVFAKLDWERLSVKLTVGGALTDGGKFTGKSTLGTTIKGAGAAAGLTLKLGGIVAYDEGGVTSAGGTANLGLKGNVLDMPTSVGLESSYARHLKGTGAANEYNVMLKLSVDF